MLLERGSRKVLGAHTIAPAASILIDEIIRRDVYAGTEGATDDEPIHIHPS
jgi:pyruvate/2-oxoglutarate dehydrogenase complex dihydrolipoamide dehydrogenase (E3) component